jgi:hypothetical protein
VTCGVEGGGNFGVGGLIGVASHGWNVELFLFAKVLLPLQMMRQCLWQTARRASPLSVI